MSKIGVFVGTAGSTSMKVVEKLSESFDIDEDDIINMEDDFNSIDDMLEYDILFIGSSTWGVGDPHYTWMDPILDLEGKSHDFSGKTVAFFGAGDSKKFSKSFVGALGKLHTAFVNCGAKPIGYIPKSLYDFESSQAELDGGQMCGCGIDEINESDKTEERIDTWIKTLKEDLAQAA